jgi:putative adhesin
MRLTSPQRRLLALGLIPVIALLVGGGAVTVATIRGKVDYDFTSAYALPRNGVSIVTDVPVTVVPSTDDEVHVTVGGTYTNLEPSVDVRQSAGEELQVSTACRGSGCRVDLTVRVPKAASVKLTTSGVPVDLIGIAGDLRLVTGDGSVNAVQLQSQEVAVTARGGSVDLSFDSPPGNVVVNTTNGSLQVLVPTDSYAIDAAAMYGSTQLDLPNELGARRQLHLRSTNGSITVAASN